MHRGGKIMPKKFGSINPLSYFCPRQEVVYVIYGKLSPNN